MSDPYLTAALAIPNVRALWRMNVTGPTADFADVSGNNWTLSRQAGTVSSTPDSPIASGDLGARCSTDADYFSAPPTTLAIAGASMVSWIRISETAGDTGIALFGLWINGLKLGLYRNQVQQYLVSGGDFTPFGSLSQDVWVLVCVAYNGTTATLRVNGSTLVASNTVSITGDVQLGVMRPVGSYEQVDYKDMMVVGRYLTDGELDALYAARLTVPRAPGASKLSISLGLSL